MTKDIIPIPENRKLAFDALKIAVKRPMVHGFLEADVTEPRRMLKGTIGADGRPLSFTSYVIATYARALHAHPALQAYRIFPNKLKVFHEVDASTLIEHDKAGGIPFPHVVRNAHAKTVREINDEVRSVKAGTHPLGRLEKAVGLATRIPRFLNIMFLNSLKFNPEWIKLIDGTTSISSFGMFSRGTTWGIGLLYTHTAGLWVGGIIEKPMAFEGRVALRDCLHATLSLDHNIVDGGPAGRFADTFIKSLESGEALEGEIAHPLLGTVERGTSLEPEAVG
jgi:pyruvate/2-oxoglutarate dehydrogenase complex dihydrolipoamide acyltransferase (E2) component